jgi:type I restriction enzyme S subunit
MAATIGTNGNLPAGWRCVKLGEVCKLQTGGTPSKSDAANFDGDIKWLVSGDVHQGEIFDCAGRITKQGMANSNASLLPPDCVLIALNGQGKTRGTVALLRVEATCNQSLVAIIPKEQGSLLSHFLLYQLRMRYQELRNLTGDSHRSGLSMGILGNLAIRLAPVSEQKRIVRILREQMAMVDKARESAQARLEAIMTLPASFLRQVFPQPDQPLPSDWHLASLDDLCNGRGQYGTSTKSNDDMKGTPILGMYHIHNGQIRWENVSHVELPRTELSKYLLNRGDLLFNRTNSAELVGKTAVYDREAEAVFASYLIRFRFAKDTADPHFVCAYINSRSGRAFIERKMGRAIGQVNISASTMGKMPIPIPHIAEQRRIVAVLHEQLAAAEQARIAAEEELRTINILPTAMLGRAFSGEI